MKQTACTGTSPLDHVFKGSGDLFKAAAQRETGQCRRTLELVEKQFPGSRLHPSGIPLAEVVEYAK